MNTQRAKPALIRQPPLGCGRGARAARSDVPGKIPDRTPPLSSVYEPLPSRRNTVEKTGTRHRAMARSAESGLAAALDRGGPIRKQTLARQNNAARNAKQW